MPNSLVSIIVLSYNSSRYIEKCLDSVLSQIYSDWEALVVINGSTDGSLELIRSRYARQKRIRILEPGENLWYSRGNNFGIAHCQGEYVLALNQDTILEPNFLRELVAVMDREPSLGSVTGKMLHYKFDIDSKTRILDSTGIEIFRTRRVIDRGQWEVDSGQYDQELNVFGASGAGALYRRSALEDAKLPKLKQGFEYFDEDFTAYKEDVDLSWRLQLLGWRCQYVPRAEMYHGRMVGRSWPTQFIRFILNRRRQSTEVRKLSFKNHYLMMVKNEVPAMFCRHFVFVLIREVLLLLYTLLFEQFQVFALVQFFRQLPDARRKRRMVMAKRRAGQRDLLQLFH